MMNSGFAADPRIARSSLPLGELSLCHVRLQDDARFPWIVLLPRRAGATEIVDLDEAGRVRLIEETALACAAVRALGEASGRPVEKLNVGALGNVVAQLHVHVVGRRRDDGLWPDPVWGRGEPRPYDADTARKAVEVARRALGL